MNTEKPVIEAPHIPISVFDIIKIGVGPSSSHTMGPWSAMRDYLSLLREKGPGAVEHLEATLMGSLARNGPGHGTHTAVMMGLSGRTSAARISPGCRRHSRACTHAARWHWTASTDHGDHGVRSWILPVEARCKT